MNGNLFNNKDKIPCQIGNRVFEFINYVWTGKERKKKKGKGKYNYLNGRKETYKVKENE